MSRTPAPRVVIIGGGFAGLYLAHGLRRAAVRVTIIDRRNHHLFQPMLYQVAAAALSPQDIAAPIRSIVRSQRNTEVLLGEVDRIDTADRRLHLTDGATIEYDYCVVAIGARHSYFGHDEWEPYAPGLKSLEDALDIRRRILYAFERAEREPDPRKRHEYLTFVVVGGGPTGVEMAGAIAEIRRFALARDFRHIDPREATVMLLEGGPRILASYPAKSSAQAKAQLRALGVDVRENTMVTSIGPTMVEASGWVIPTTTVIWAAGNEIGALTRTLGVPLDRAGRVVVEPDCSIPGHPEVFVLGDAAAFTHQKGSTDTLPGVSPVAIQMGQYAARTIKGDLAGRPRTPFSYWNKGQLAVIGRGHAVADIAGFQFSGFFAWLVWAVVHIFFLIGFRNRVMVLLEWSWAYLRYSPGARLITGDGILRTPLTVTGEHPVPPAIAGPTH
ncbi:MAG: NAD(P)/FAD-dependent oxidoreductase [Gemmatimonadales bacterium]|nr:NAD(P)/FAD-dependent oxidoreductase [Gemmatimonadales bacterium]